MRTPICSIGRFERMTKSFKKYATKQIMRNPHLEETPYIYFFVEGVCGNNASDFEKNILKLFNRFKCNQYKTKSCYLHRGNYYRNNYKIWVSYTIQDQTGKRCYDKDFNNKEVAFKIHMQIDNHRKKRIAIWKVKLNN